MQRPKAWHAATAAAAAVAAAAAAAATVAAAAAAAAAGGGTAAAAAVVAAAAWLGTVAAQASEDAPADVAEAAVAAVAVAAEAVEAEAAAAAAHSEARLEAAVELRLSCCSAPGLRPRSDSSWPCVRAKNIFTQGLHQTCPRVKKTRTRKFADQKPGV
jgi:hypothetical protein